MNLSITVLNTEHFDMKEILDFVQPMFSNIRRNDASRTDALKPIINNYC